MTDCPKCESLRAQVRALQAELGLRMRDGAMGALMERFKLEAMGALLLVGLYQAKGRACSTEYLRDFIGSDSLDVIKVHICRLRKRIGHDSVACHTAHGYSLTPAGMSRVLAALEPVGVQDVRDLV